MKKRLCFLTVALVALAAAGAFAGDQVVLTPHPGELARMTGLTSDEIAARRLELVPELAQRWRAVLLLKGSPTVIGLPDGRLFFNPSGDDALARGGAGDAEAALDAAPRRLQGELRIGGQEQVIGRALTNLGIQLAGRTGNRHHLDAFSGLEAGRQLAQTGEKIGGHRHPQFARLRRRHQQQRRQQRN